MSLEALEARIKQLEEIVIERPKQAAEMHAQRIEQMKKHQEELRARIESARATKAIEAAVLEAEKTSDEPVLETRTESPNRRGMDR
jgi:hypothetical protein